MKNFMLLGFMILMVFSCSTTPKYSYRDAAPAEWVVEAYETLAPIQTVVVSGGTNLETLGTKLTDNEEIKIEVVPGQSHRTGDYSVKSSLKVVKQLAELGNCLVFNQKFYDEIKAHKQFDYTKDDSVTVAQNLSLYTPVVLSTFYKPWPSKTVAYRNVGSNVLYLNTRFLSSKPTKENLNTIWHERSHVVGYGHGDNNKTGKENSVSYGTGSDAEKYFDECYVALK